MTKERKPEPRIDPWDIVPSKRPRWAPDSLADAIAETTEVGGRGFDR